MESDDLFLLALFVGAQAVGWRPERRDVTFASFVAEVWGLDGDDDEELTTTAAVPLPPLEAPDVEEDGECSVCLEPTASPTSAVTSLLPQEAAALVAAFCDVALRRPPCGHAFHSACLERWARGRAAVTCPVCRGPV